MIGTFVLMSVWLHNTGQCMELNSLEISPFYDAIIFGDIAEIINDMDSNMNFQTDKKQTSENESDEEIESLLSEYQHYVEKAEKQRAKYFEKSNLKNKVPLLRHERFTKLNFPKTQFNSRNPKMYASNIQLSQKAYKHPYDMLSQITPGEVFPPLNKLIWKDNKNSHKTENDVILSSCFCEENKFPCRCNCKQCLIPLEKKVDTYFEPFKPSFKDNALKTSSNSYRNMGYFNENADDKTENILNIRIKFDIQLPKFNDVLKKAFKSLNVNKTVETENTDDNDKPVTISTPNLNFPIPLSIFTYGESKIHNYDYTPLHKTHKKKKTHTNYPSKKHRSKFLTIHHGKLATSQNLLLPETYNNDSRNINDTELNIQPNTTREMEPSPGGNISDVNSIDQGYILNMSTFLNISNDDNFVEDTTTEKHSNILYTLSEDTNSTDPPQYYRVKREDKFAINNNDTVLNNSSLKLKDLNGVQKVKNESGTRKKIDNKQQLSDSDLLYWPNNSENKTDATRKVQYNNTLDNNANDNITYTTNLNASWQKALSKINWTDIDIAASTFSSLTGKHANGILTFCSENRCRSVKCTEKLCVHRTCYPDERYNQNGHCSLAANGTDSTISMESSLDVSFDIACELVETLQDQLLGYTYGKATICIHMKCVTLVANKKSFTKTKCSKKQLSLEGHCQSLKNANIV